MSSQLHEYTLKHVRGRSTTHFQTVGQGFLHQGATEPNLLCTSAEVLHELAHAYLAAGRPRIFDVALALVSSFGVEVWPLEEVDVALARRLHELHPTLQTWDLCHMASCRRRGVRDMKTFDQALAGVFSNSSSR
ncbi:MAG: PIN domain-containing protein [Caldilineaceae bacterium SB0661_bin_34]|nr:PIN domain-containing protein [Caldilineaceae bacterium SB0661_bin_34]